MKTTSLWILLTLPLLANAAENTGVDPQLILLKDCAQTSYDIHNGGLLVNTAKRLKEAQADYAVYSVEYNQKYAGTKPTTQQEYALFKQKYDEFNAKTQQLSTATADYNLAAQQSNSKVDWFTQSCKGKNFNQYLWGQLPVHLRKTMDW